MKKMMLVSLVLFLFAGMAFAQEESDHPEIKKEKKIMIKIVDEDGKITTKVLTDEGTETIDENIWISESGDSIRVEVEVDDEGGKILKKRIVIPGMEDIDIDLGDIEKEIEILEFDSEHFPGKAHMYFFGEDDKHPGWNVFKNGPHGFTHAKSDKAKLGVYIEDAEKGVKVTEVIENSAAYSIGILSGDVITEIDGKKMTNKEELIREVGSHKAGDFINIKLKRNGKNKKFEARLHGEAAFDDFMVMPPPQKLHFEEFGPHMKKEMKQLKHECEKQEKECKHLKEKIDKELKWEMKEKKKEIKKKMQYKKQEKIEKEMQKEEN